MSGIFGVASKEDCTELLFYGTDYHSHLGTAYGGMAVLGDIFVRQIHDLSQGQFKSKFYEDFRHMKGNKGIGVISDCDEQPIYINSKFGPFCIVTNGFIENAEKLTHKLLKKGISFSEMSQGNINMTELVAKLITQGKDLIDGIEKMFSVIDGSCSLLILNEEGIYAARDRYGYTPLVVGHRDNAYAVTTESSAFPNTEFKTIKYLEPGEITLINETGVVEKRKGKPVNKICAFLWIYTGFPASNYEGINTEMVRERCGQCLARSDNDIEIDFVSGVPDSGMGHGLGYAMESKIPMRRSLVKYTPGYGRSYVPPTQDTRDLIARMKLIPIREIIENKKVLLCEDSIVRGTQLKNYTIKKLWDADATEVHVRVACPPLMFPCKFNLSTRSINELAARKAIRSIEGYDLENVEEYINPDSEKYLRMVEWIASDLEVTTLRYLSIDDIVSAIGLPKEKLCLYCWTGEST
ncbi:amidophosphoribosyltransferase [Candidatus Latescibacterota bacterium]